MVPLDTHAVTLVFPMISGGRRGSVLLVTRLSSVSVVEGELTHSPYWDAGAHVFSAVLGSGASFGVHRFAFGCYKFLLAHWVSSSASCLILAIIPILQMNTQSLA